MLVLAKMSVELCSENLQLSIIPPPNVQNFQKLDKLLKSSPNGQYGSASLITVSVMHQDCITALKKSSQIAAPNSQNGAIGYSSLLKISDINGVSSAENTAYFVLLPGLIDLVK